MRKILLLLAGTILSVSGWSQAFFPLYEISANTQAELFLEGPAGLSTAPGGYLYLVDNAADRVLKLDRDGSFLCQWGGSGNGPGEFNDPVDVCVDSLGNVYITDVGNKRIQKFDSLGNHLLSFGNSGSSPARLDSIQGMAYDPNGFIYVLDAEFFGSRKVRQFDLEGNFINDYGNLGGPTGLTNPIGIAVDDQGQVFIVDSTLASVKIYDDQGNFVSSFDTRNDGRPFANPQDVGVDDQGNIFVIDIDLDSLFKLDASFNFVAATGMTGNGDDLFGRSGRIFVDESGDVFASDQVNSYVQRFSNDLAFEARFGTSATDQDGQFDGICGLDVDDNGRILAADSGNDRIQVFDPDGQFLRAFGASGSANGEFMDPIRVEADAMGRIYVLDRDRQDVQRFDGSGNFIDVVRSFNTVPLDFHLLGDGSLYYTLAGDIGVSPSFRKMNANGSDGGGVTSFGPTQQNFGEPVSITGDTSGHIYVLDAGNHAVYKFSANMGFLSEWGSQGSGPGEFESPQGIRVDHEGNILVADSGNGRIQKFDSDGNFILEYGSSGSRLGAFLDPQMAVTDSAGQLYVAEKGNNRIQVLEICEVLTEVDIDICQNEEYDFFGRTLFTAGTYRDTVPRENECDSIVVLNLSILPIFSTRVDSAICQGDTVLFGGERLAMSGTYRDTLPSVQNGCDSAIALVLTVKDTFFTRQLDTLCRGEAIVWGGQNITTSGTYRDTFPENDLRCDSIVERIVTVLDTFRTVIRDTVCFGETYTFENQNYTSTGTYEYVYPRNENRCDSVIEIRLVVEDQLLTQRMETICAGESFVFEGQVLRDEGVYPFTYPATEDRCDSTVEITLQVLPTFDTTIQRQVCAGDTLRFEDLELSQAGMYSYTYPPTMERCDSVIRIDLQVLDTLFTARFDTICQGEAFIFEGDLLTRTGVYRYVFPQPETGCDSTVEINLTVLPTPSVLIREEICDGETFIFEDLRLTRQGQYQYVFPPTETRCDSTVIIDLRVLPSYEQRFPVELCEGDTLFLEDQFRTTNGDLEYTYQAVNGCDSVVILEANFLNTFYEVVDSTICIGERVQVGNAQIGSPGTFLFTFPPTAERCDSTVELNITVLDTFFVAAERTICRGEVFQLGDSSYTEPGVYRYTFPPTETRCDSTVALTLRVLEPRQGMTNIDICEGDSLLIGGRVLRTPGQYSVRLTAANGCDSILQVNLGQLPLAFLSIRDTICSREFYNLNGTLINQAGTHYDTLQAANGCDSIIRLDLVVNQSLVSTIDATICEGESFRFAGEDRTETGLYVDSLLGPEGCYFYNELHLTVNPTYYDTVVASICEGETFAFDGQVYDSTGLYRRSYLTVNGCDSIRYLDLTVNREYNNRFRYDLCQGDTVYLGSRPLFQTGIYRDTFQSRGSCDSIVLVDLRVGEVYQDTVDLYWCGVVPYDFGPLLLDATGTYTYTFMSRDGCDSTVTLNLTYEPLDLSLNIGGVLLSANQRDATYQWVDCADTSLIAGETDRFFLPRQNGNYAVFIQTDSCLFLSECMQVLITSTEQNDISSGVLLYPNPTHDDFYLEMSPDLLGVYQVQIMNLQGKQHYRREQYLGQNERIETSKLPPGMYLLLLQDEDGRTARLRFTKLRR